MRPMSILDRVRAAGWKVIDGRGGALGDTARRVNDALGKPLAPADELADRQAFAAGYAAAPPAAAPAASAPSAIGEPAPVVVYYMDKQRRDVPRLTQILDDAGIPYQTMSLEGDEAAQVAVRRDSKGHRLPLVFIAGEVVGGRTELTNLDRTGELKRRVFGA
jgi:glutaredoxin